MPTYDVTEAARHIKPELMTDFKEALANADRDGQEVYSVIVANGVPIVYSVRDKS